MKEEFVALPVTITFPELSVIRIEYIVMLPEGGVQEMFAVVPLSSGATVMPVTAAGAVEMLKWD